MGDVLRKKFKHSERERMLNYIAEKKRAKKHHEKMAQKFDREIKKLEKKLRD